MSFSKPQVSFSSNFASIFSVMRHKSSILFKLKFDILLTKGACQSTILVKFHVSSRKSELLRPDGFLLSKSYKVSANKVQKSYLSLKSDAKFKEKLTCGFKCDMSNLVNFHLITLKSENFFSMDSFCPKYTWFELQKYRAVISHDTEQ